MCLYTIKPRFLVCHYIFVIGTSPPSPVEVIGPFIAWGPPARHDGEILHYEVKVTSATGAYAKVEKNKMDVYHMLEREDVPKNLGRTTSVAIQVMHAYKSTVYHQIFKAHNFHTLASETFCIKQILWMIHVDHYSLCGAKKLCGLKFVVGGQTLKKIKFILLKILGCYIVNFNPCS